MSRVKFSACETITPAMHWPRSAAEIHADLVQKCRDLAAEADVELDELTITLDRADLESGGVFFRVVAWSVNL